MAGYVSERKTKNYGPRGEKTYKPYGNTPCIEY